MRKGLSMSMRTMVQVGPVLEAMEDILAALLRSLDGRVYVAVGRGLWDFTSKDIYDYVDSLQEGKENKVGACACQSLCGLPDQPSYILQLASNATHLLHLKSWYRICSLPKLGKHHGVPS